MAGWVGLWVLEGEVGGGEFRAGAARVNITPSLGVEINGGTHPAYATHVHDELWARALVLEDGGGRLVFVVVDNCLLPRPLVDEAKALIARHCGIPAERVCVSATHTHSAGSVVGAHLSEPEPGYAAGMPGRISDAVRIAVNRLAPAELGWGAGSVPAHVFCRRVLVKPGVVYTNLLGRTGDAVKMNWSSPEPGVDGEFAGPTDPELFVLAVREAGGGRPLGMLANYSLHYVGGVGAGHISADYFGVFAEKLEDALGVVRQDPPFVAMLSNGTSGDINNIDYRVRAPARRPYEQIERVAGDVAAEAMRVWSGLEWRSDITLAAAAAELEVGVRKPSAGEVARARALLGGRDRKALRTWTEIYARETLILSEYPDRVRLPLQVFRVGGVTVAQWPGEIFAVSGLALKAEAAAGRLFNIGLANGWFGYIPPPEEHERGAYETWRGRTSPLETGAIPAMHRRFLELAGQVRAR